MSKITLDNFEIVNIQQKEIEESYECKVCMKNVHILSLFDRCEHYCCTDCVDILYDTYDTYEDKDVFHMFLCPFCNEKVNNINYKYNK
jgi:hypothetical protein